MSDLDKKNPECVKDEYPDDEKYVSTDIQDINTPPLPAALAAMSEADLKKLERKATWKLDLVILSGVCVMYILNYLDRQNISAARLAGIQEDLGLSDVQYQTAVSILFVGYSLQIPSNMIASSIKSPATYINGMMVVWGVISACTAAVRGPPGLYVVRVLLGACECAFFPGVVYYMTTFYNRSQLASRTAIMYSGSQMGNAFGNLIAIGILKLDGYHGIAGWRWLFLIEGVITVGVGLIFMVVLPSNPRTTKLLSEPERELVLYNLSRYEYGNDYEQQEYTHWESFKMCVLDIKTWFLCGIVSITFAAAIVNFFPSVVNTLGYDRQTTYILTAPPYLLCVITLLINGYFSDRLQKRVWFCLWPQVVTVIANCIAVATLNTGARYFAMMLMPTGTYTSIIIALSWISSTLNEPKSKRATAVALINTCANTPNVWCSYLYTGEPYYYPAFSVNIVAGVVNVCLVLLFYVYLRRCNARLEKGEEVYGVTEHQHERGFRFML